MSLRDEFPYTANRAVTHAELQAGSRLAVRRAYHRTVEAVRGTPVYGHFGTKTLRHRCRSVRRTLRHRSAPITEIVMLVNGGST